MKKYEVIRRFNFTSGRKRMSALVRDPADKRIKLLMKGADTIVLARLDKEQAKEECNAEVLKQANKFLHDASVNGLRTLCMAVRIVEEDELKAFEQKLATAE
jgi:magnesium-transporting ATPase (P-type)